MTKRLTVREAWAEVAKRLAAQCNCGCGDAYSGLCLVIGRLRREQLISRWTEWRMRRPVDKMVKLMGTAFVWPISAEGRACRIAWCQRRAGISSERIYPERVR